MPVLRLVFCFLAMIVAVGAMPSSALAGTQGSVQLAQADTAEQGSKVKPSQLLLQRRNAAKDEANEGFFDNPVGWIQTQQRRFYGKMSKAVADIKSGSSFYAAMLLMSISFAYGVLHAAGPGHGKAVISAWMLANEQQLKRGIGISFLAAIIQALTAIVLVSVLLLTVKAAAATAKSMTLTLEAFSYFLIALTGLWLVWQAIGPRLRQAQPQEVHVHAHAHASHGHGHDHHHGHAHSHAHHDHDHHHHHDHGHHDHVHGVDCGCGHAHMPSAAELDKPVSFWKSASIAFAVGIRPCTGGVLVLLFSSAVGLYWIGIISTFFMALGTALTVSAIAAIAVKFRSVALRLSGNNAVWLDRTAFSLKLVGGLFITAAGGLLFWATATNSSLLS